MKILNKLFIVWLILATTPSVVQGSPINQVETVALNSPGQYHPILGSWFESAFSLQWNFYSDGTVDGHYYQVEFTGRWDIINETEVVFYLFNKYELDPWYGEGNWWINPWTAEVIGDTMYYQFNSPLWGLISTDAEWIGPSEPESSVMAFVTRFYDQCLGREPDRAGLYSWVNALVNSTLCGANLANGFIFSPEFTNRNTSNEEFVIILYRAFFDREPDAGGYYGWVNFLYSGASRQNVLDGFIYSVEFENLCDSYGINPYSGFVSESSVEDFVTRFYQHCLDREPDQPGLEGWVNALIDGSLSGANVAYAFIFSPEFASLNTSNEEYMTILYRAFFDREPDTGGYNGWVNFLYSGAGRQDVLDGFIYSVEFENLCSNYGITPYSD